MAFGRLTLALALVLWGTGCATVTPVADDSAWPAPVEGRDLGVHVGARVSVTGREAREIWQHLVGGVQGKQPVYFDLRDRQQIVVHVAESLHCTGEAELAGTVLEVRGASKRPDREGQTKVDDTYTEYATRRGFVRCLAGSP